MSACADSNRHAAAPAQVVVTAPPVPAAPLPPPPPDDPTAAWHTYAPRPVEGTSLYRAVDLNVTAPSIWGGPCSLAEVVGATFLVCGSIARVDGDALDISLPSPSTTTSRVYGRYPDDLWASDFHGNFSDGYEPPKDSFRESDYTTMRFENGKWRSYPTSATPVPYVDHSSLLFVTPPITDPKAETRPPSCADYSCYRTLPRVMTTGAVKPDFSALAGRITWIHHHDETEDVPDDFSFVVDPNGPVWVFMRAMDLKTNKKGFGVARWSRDAGASFEWLPGALATKKRLTFFDGTARDGKVDIAIDGDANVSLAFDGRSWKQGPARTRTTTSGEPELTGRERYYAEGSTLKERMPDGTERSVPGIDDSRFVVVVTKSEDDVWVFTYDAVFRTVKPREVLYRTESFGELHPFPAPVGKGDECAHPFAILDAASSRRAEQLRAHAWGWSGIPGVVETELFGQVIVGVPARSVAHGEKILEDEQQDPGRMMEGAPHHVVCAAPVAAKPFVSRVTNEGRD